jgi:Kef-type K+ transport system membrane component KefB
MIRATFLLAIVVTLIAAARSFLPDETPLVGSGAALAFGFVLLAALQTGTIVSTVNMPRLTGYLLCGFIAGPSVLNFVTERMVMDLKLVNNVAIGLIALSAGGELNFKRLRPRMRAILSIGGISMVFSIVVMSAAVMAMSRFLPFMADMDVYHRGVVSLTMGVVLAALSPTVVLALLNETGAEGPISETILGVVVLADLAIIFAFAAVNSLANSAFGATEGASVGGVARDLLIHIFGSLAVGAGLGVLITLYIKKLNARVALFVFGICFLAAEAGVRLHLDPLLMCLSAGLLLENLTAVDGSALIHDIEAASMPVFAVFFAVAGASLQWSVFRKVAAIAIALAVVRAVALLMGASFGMTLGKVPAEQRKTIPYGLLSQTGVAIGLAILVEKHFPVWGGGASACLLGVVMVNQLVGPVLFRNALAKSGEAGKKVAVASAR